MLRFVCGIAALAGLGSIAAAAPLDCPSGTQRKVSADEEYCASANGRHHGPARELHKNGAIRRELTYLDGKVTGEVRCFTGRGHRAKCATRNQPDVDSFVDTIAELDQRGRKLERVRAEKQLVAFCDLDERRAKLEEEFDEECVPWSYPGEPDTPPCARRVVKGFEQRIRAAERAAAAAERKLDAAYPPSKDALLAKLVASGRACHCPTQNHDSNYRAGVVRRMQRGPCRD